jgi:hypothetical protein
MDDKTPQGTRPASAAGNLRGVACGAGGVTAGFVVHAVACPPTTTAR